MVVEMGCGTWPGAVILRRGAGQTGSKGVLGPSHLWRPQWDSDLGPPERSGPQGPAGRLPTRQMEAKRGRGGA